MGLLGKLFGDKSGQIKIFKDRGAVVVDVRTPGEFEIGHVKGSKNIPLQSIAARKAEILKWKKPVILCCASGMRSGQATGLLKNEGVECMNGGSWSKVNKAYV